MVKSKPSTTARVAAGHKEAQLDIILASNPAPDEYHVWIRTVDDILTFQEAVEADMEGVIGSRYDESWTPDFLYVDAENAIREGRIEVYSSHPIDQGTFVTPSRREAQSYAGGSRVYSMNVRLDQVAWIDALEGQFADVRRTRR